MEKSGKIHCGSCTMLALKSFFSSQDPGLDVASRKYLLLKGLLLCAMSMNYDL